MAFIISLEKVCKAIVLSVFCLSLFHTPNVYASPNSEEERIVRTPSPKRSKSKEVSGDDRDVLHAISSDAPLPTISLTHTSDIAEALASSSVPQSFPSLKGEIVESLTSTDATRMAHSIETAPPSSLPYSFELQPTFSSEECSTKTSPLPLLPKGKETFYIFNVGQGNSQLAIYDEGGENPFGVLYDCGSSTEYVREKVTRVRFKNSQFQTFLSKHTLSATISSLGEVFASASSSHQTEDVNKSTESSKSDENMSHDSQEKTQKKNIDTSNVEDIREILQTTSIQNLFVFLSHSDKDHINLISHAIPDNLRVLFVLCGNFLSYNQSENLLEDVDKVLSFISKRSTSSKTYFSLPYLWEHPEYRNIKKTITTYSADPKTLREYLKPTGQISPRVQGSLNKFLKMMKIFDEDFIQEQNAFKNIYIWLLNKTSSNPNNTCPVISFRMPALQQTFICTGDSETDIFGDISQNISSRNSKNKTFELSTYVRKKLGFSAETQNPYSVLLMLPHHGALTNLSLPMIDLFQPHLLCISAGAGTIYPHPNFNLIKTYEDYYKSQGPLQVRVKQFWSLFQFSKPYYYISYTGDKKENRKLYLGTLATTNLPVLCTNVLGTIKITTDGFLSFFTSSFDIDGKSYYLKFKNRLNNINQGPGENEITHMIKAENETIQRDIYRKSENNENVFIKLNSDRSIDDSTILFRIETEIEGAYYLGKKFSNVEGTQNAQN